MAHRTEHEKFVFHTCCLTPVPYEGPDGIRALMEALIQPTGGSRYGRLKHHRAEAADSETQAESRGTIKPGARRAVRVVGAPLQNLHQTAAETQEHLREVIDVGEDLGIGFIGVGFSPKWTLAETPQMPKQRYNVMTRYMPQVGKRGPRYEVPYGDDPGEPRLPPTRPTW